MLALLLLGCTENTLHAGDPVLSILSPAAGEVFDLNALVPMQSEILYANGVPVEDVTTIWSIQGQPGEEQGNSVVVRADQFSLGMVTLIAESSRPGQDGEPLRDTVTFRVVGGDETTSPDETGDPPDTEPPDTEPPEDSTEDPPDTSEDPYCYEEPLYPNEDISDLVSGFRSSNARDTAFEVLERRWPAGHALLVAMNHDPYIDVFLNTSSFSYMSDSLGTVVHEETHGWDYENTLWNRYFSYFLRSDMRYEIEWDEGFGRSEIYNHVEGNATSLYDSTYLTGTQGTYSWHELLDETNSYINGLAGSIAVHDHMPWGISAKDGPLALLYYIELYLKVARTDHPEFYDRIKRDEVLKEMVLIFWLRTHYFLEKSADMPQLGIYDDEIEALLYKSENQQEIEDYLGLELAASSCLP